MEAHSRMWFRQWTISPTDVWWMVWTWVCTGLVLTGGAAVTASPVQSITGMLYAENFTYYKLSGEGWLRLELFSLKGDVDIYVSGLTLTPSFSDYELKSESCGVDTVDIHSTMNRPVGIGIYAHPSYLQSAFRMDIQVVMDFEIDEYEQLFKAFHFYESDDVSAKEESKSRSSRKSKASSDSEEEEKESIWWTILITILKFILEVIV
ncbi:UPF0669 protein C6orf120 homolog [Babylonia areolata]|uniref:UPF0669 protein C6orf120 homolog n=1 Tax=Babylonia areolata TaxID=304850 RepID=UPI003FD4FD1D